MAFFVAAFSVSVFCVVSLFVLKSYEERRGVTFFPRMRERADVHALYLKSRVMDALEKGTHLPTFLLVFSKQLVHIAARALAHAARSIEAFAHTIADRVSHKHKFERKEGASPFLKKMVEERKNSF